MQGFSMKIYIPPKNNRYRKKSAALPAAALPFTAADRNRNRNRTAQNFFEILLAIPYSAALQKISIFENAALVRESAHVYAQVCFANLRLNGTRYFSVPFKLSVRAARRHCRCLAFRLFYILYASFLCIHFLC